MYNYNDCTQDDSLMQFYAGDKKRPVNAGNSNQNLVSSYEGFIRGNLFDELYSPYTSLEPFNLNPRSEREALLNIVREYEFAMQELNLYLDVYPNDREKLEAFNHYRLLEKKACDEYEARYGPLTINSETTNAYPWSWINNPWPWEAL